MGHPADKRKSPRFILKNDDYRVGRFSSFSWLKTKKILQTQIFDISSKGISFLVPSHQIPPLGTKIGVEFTVPGSEQIACVGKVVRVADIPMLAAVDSVEVRMPQFKIGVEFENMPPAYQRMLDAHLKDALKNERRNAFANELQYEIEKIGVKIHTTARSIPNTAVIAVLSLMTIIGMVYLAFKMQEVAKTKWWLKEAHEFSQHMYEEKLKEDAAQKAEEAEKSNK